MIFYGSVILFWINQLIFAVTFGDLSYDAYHIYGGIAQSILICLMILNYLSLQTSRSRSVFFLTALYLLYQQMTDLVFGDINVVYYVIETVFFLIWTAWIAFRPQIRTEKKIDKNNILLAFYKGGKGSFLMNFFELFGLPVKSMCIVAGDLCLTLKMKKDTFQILDSNVIFKNKNDFIIIDTGVVPDAEFMREMKENIKLSATKKCVRTRCIEAINKLLGLIGEEWKAKGYLEYIPGVYLKKVMKL